MTCAAWPITWPCDINGVNPDALEQAQALAQQLLWALSGYRLGVCDYHEAIRPQCQDRCVAPYKGTDGLWYNGGVADCCELLMAHRPVWTVTEVIELGRTLTTDEYVLEGNYLRRRYACWACGALCDDAPIEVRYTAGTPVPPGTALVMGEVGCEYLAALDNRPCKLPSRATSISRQGVTVELGSPDDFLNAGRLGLPLTDAWLTGVNQGGLKGPSKVYSPDLPRATAIRG
jgi:hypothetical protein